MKHLRVKDLKIGTFTPNTYFTVILYNFTGFTHIDNYLTNTSIESKMRPAVCLPYHEDDIGDGE